jgi:hypothetical protein
MLIKKCGDTYSFSVLFVKFAIQNKVRFKLKHNKNIIYETYIVTFSCRHGQSLWWS